MNGVWSWGVVKYGCSQGAGLSSLRSRSCLWHFVITVNFFVLSKAISVTSSTRTVLLMLASSIPALLIKSVATSTRAISLDWPFFPPKPLSLQSPETQRSRIPPSH